VVSAVRKEDVMKRLVAVVGSVAMLAAVAQPASAQRGRTGVIPEVRAEIAKADFARGEAVLKSYQDRVGNTTEVLEAMSWLGRGALAAGQLDAAERYADETYRLSVAKLPTIGIDSDAHLEISLGAAIEVKAQVEAARGDRADALDFLQQELDTYGTTNLHKRIEKNINLLSLDGQRAPALDGVEHLGPSVPTFADLKGKVVLLFFWAHWCPDCKAESPILAKLLDKYHDQGLTMIAPTQRYGYTARGKDAAPDEERDYIVKIRDQYYPFLANVPVPMAEANHKRYGVSTTPTLALVDRQGIIRLYHPGQMTEEELDAAIRKLL
jgi:thiol-disulfide isomerase/thioredoxin